MKLKREEVEEIIERFIPTGPFVTALPIPHLDNDAAPSVGDHTKLIFLAGAIKYWWEGDRWGGPEHTAYVSWRHEVRRALIDAGHLTYAPHEAFKGTWTERAQAVNNAGILTADLMLVLSPLHAETPGTDEEVEYAKRVGTPVLYAPPGSSVNSILNAIPVAPSRIIEMDRRMSQEEVEALRAKLEREYKEPHRGNRTGWRTRIARWTRASGARS